MDCVAAPIKGNYRSPCFSANFTKARDCLYGSNLTIGMEDSGKSLDLDGNKGGETQGQCTLNRELARPSFTPLTFGLESNRQFNTKSMARTQAMKRRLFGFAGTSNPAAGLATSPTRPQAPAGDLSPVSEASGMASRGTFARMRRFFHRSSKGPSTTVATETTGADIRVEAQEQQGPHHAGQVQEVCRQAMFGDSDDAE
ncbi:hypothetical protein EV401DRAFT_1887477 [Pisolithus croceorrhizus]|nr:hypothetical protein EV401DRAFT_1887477 [Pisolithus croceorrhizus]